MNASVGQVAHDLPCRACGYNLRGLSRSSICPECSAPIRSSMTGDLLQYAHPRWLHRARRGLLAVFAGQCVLVLAGFLTIYAMLPAVQTRLIGWRIATAASLATAALLGGIGLIGCTHAERRIDSVRYSRIIRLGVRACGAALIPAVLFAVALRFISVPAFNVAAGVSVCVIAALLLVLHPLWLHELLRRTTLGRKEDSPIVGAWLATGATMCLVVSALAYQFRWETGSIAAFLLVGASPLYALTMFVALWRTLAALRWEARASQLTNAAERADQIESNPAP